MTFTLGGYTRGIEEGWPAEDTYRWIVCQLPRSFLGRSAAEQRAALAERVPLTGTKWDALLAAMVEHVAWLHGHERRGLICPLRTPAASRRPTARRATGRGRR